VLKNLGLLNIDDVLVDPMFANLWEEGEFKKMVTKSHREMAEIRRS